MKIKLTALILALVMLLCGCGINNQGDSEIKIPTETFTQEQLAQQAEFDKYVDEFTLFLLEGNEMAYKLYYDDFEAKGLVIKDYMPINSGYISMTDEEKEAHDAKMNEFYDGIASFDRESLTIAQQVAYDNFAYERDFNERYDGVKDYTMLIAPTSGWIGSIGSSGFYEYPFTRAKDVDDYLKFLSNMPEALEFVIEYTQGQIDSGIYPSAYTLDTNIEYLKNYSNETETPFIDGFESKIDACDFLSDTQKLEYKSSNEKIVKEELFPACSSTIDALKKWKAENYEAKPLCEMEGGKESYEMLLEIKTNTRMSPDDVYKMLRECMNEIINDAVDYFTYQKYISGNYSVDFETVDDMMTILKEKTKAEFPEFTDPGCDLSDLPESLSQESVSAYYVSPPIDVERPNTVRLNRKNLGYDKVDVFLTLAHESYPGHLYSNNFLRQYGMDNTALSYIAYGEGWAEYARKVAAGWIGAGEKMGDLLFANYIANQIICSVADIGVHVYGWGANELADYLYEVTGDRNMSAASEIYNMILADPCIIQPYAVGYCMIYRMMNRLKDEQGRKFNEKEFRLLFLTYGPAPFDIVEQKINEYYANKK